ncbi:unnamed protein product [Strongylus vulgaris]|uniref:VWFA domain-containing protein n=1 Tax=Strongylus vulgaris TaxID=40348 RepID=A0A3P7I276_STRVU|nr:unnamed protein product [Strongylus vulgaris]
MFYSCDGTYDDGFRYASKQRLQFKCEPYPAIRIFQGPKEEYRCLFVGDLYNFGNNTEIYDKETEFIAELAYEFFEDKRITAIGGVWAYGYTAFPEAPDLSKMENTFSAFLKDLDKMDYTNVSDALNTTKAIDVINKVKQNGTQVNCLVFFSAQKETSSLPKLEPENEDIKRIIGVGLAGNILFLFNFTIKVDLLTIMRRWNHISCAYQIDFLKPGPSLSLDLGLLILK